MNFVCVALSAFLFINCALKFYIYLQNNRVHRAHAIYIHFAVWNMSFQLVWPVSDIA